MIYTYGLSIEQSAGIAGSVTVTQAAQSLSAQAQVAIAGSVTITQASQSISAHAGSPAVTGTLTVSQAAEIVSATGNTVIGGAASTTQAPNTASAAASTLISGHLVATQGAQTMSANGGPTVVGSASSGWSRSSSGTYIDASGTLQTAPANVPRIDHSPISPFADLGPLFEPQRTNQIRNPRGEGIVGTVPNYWSAVTNGLSVASTAVGAESGVPYVDIRFSVANTGGVTAFALHFEGATQIAAATGQTWTSSCFWKLAGGSLANVTSFQLQFLEKDASANNSGGSPSYSQATPSTAQLVAQRRIATGTLSGTNTAFVVPRLLILCAANSAIDFTLRLGAPQFEQASTASSVILPPAGSPAATTRAADQITAPAQTLAAAAGPIVVGQITAGQPGNALSAAAGPVVQGSLSAAQVGQTFSAAAAVPITASLSATQAANTLSAVGGAGIDTATLAASQAANTVAATAAAKILGSTSITQSNQALSAVGSLLAGGALHITAEANSLSAAAAAPIAGTLSSGLTRASSATYIDANGVMQVAPSNAPRVTHDIAAPHTLLGALLEGSSSNLLSNNSNLSLSHQGANAVAQTADIPPLLAGQSVMKHSILDASNAYFGFEGPGLVVAAGEYIACSFYAWVPSTNAAGGIYTLTYEAPGTPPTVLLDASKTDQWQRVTGVYKNTTTNTTSGNLILKGGYGAGAVPGWHVGDVIYTTGWQVEPNATVASSYIPTYGSVATRAADQITAPGQAIVAGGGPVTGSSLSVGQDQQVLSASAASIAAGRLAVAQQPNTAAYAGTVLVSGRLSAIQDAQALSGAGGPLVVGNASSGLSRASTATYIDAGGVMRIAPLNVPRIDHALTPDHRALGSLIEPGSTNYETNALGAINGSQPRFSSVISSDVMSIFPGAKVRKVTDVTGTGDNNFGNDTGLSVTAGQSWTFSLYIWIPSSFTGSALSIPLGGNFALTSQSVANLSLRDQWQRVSVTGTVSTTSAGTIFWVGRITSNLNDFFYWTCPQTEPSPFPTSFIPTSNGIVSRAADQITDPGQTLTAAGGPVVTGPVLETQNAQVLSASGVLPVAGHLAITQAPNTVAATGVNPIAAGLSKAQPDQALSAAVISSWRATLAVTQAAQTIAGTAGPVARGSLSQALASQQLSASATVLVSGSGVVGGAPNSLNASGGPTVVGGLTVHQADEALVAVGLNKVTATLNLAQADQQVVASAGPVMGLSLAASQQSQALSGTASVAVVGHLGVTQSAQGASASGTVLVAGTAVVAQTNQGLVAAAGTVVTGGFTVLQAAQQLVASSRIVVLGTLTATQGGAVLAASGSVRVGGQVAATQQDQTASAAGAVRISAHVTVVQGDNAPSARGSVFTGIALTVRQSDQGISATARILTGAALTALQQPNAMVGEVKVGKFGASATREVFVTPLARSAPVRPLNRTAFVVPMIRIVQVAPE